MPRSLAPFDLSVGSRGARLRRRGLAVVAALLLIAGIAGPAEAAPYEISGCKYNRPNDFDLSIVTGGPNRVNECGTKGIGITANGNVLSPNGNNELMGISIELNPARLPNTTITNAVADLRIASKTGDGFSTGSYSMHSESGMVQSVPIPGGNWPGEVTTYGAALSPPSRFVRWVVSCWGPCTFGGSPNFAVSNFVISLQDGKAPAVADPDFTGLLEPGAVQSGTRTLTFSASDADSGIKAVELRTAAGVRITGTPVNANCAYNRAEPCPKDPTNLQLSVNTAALPDGSNALQLWSYDASDNVSKKALPAVVVRNSVPVATPAPAPVAVVTPTPVPNQTGATPTPTPTGAAKPTPTPAVATDTGSTGGPGSGSTPPVLAATAVAFRVSSKAPRRGVRVVFSGTVTPVPAVAGRVLIEAKSKKKWITAAVVRTREGGAFVWNHTFSRRGTYTMRARLLTSVESKTKPSVSPKRVFRVR